MSINRSRFNEIRSRLINLHNILSNRLYSVLVTPNMLMSIDEVRDRETFTQEAFANDAEYYSTHQYRRFTIPMLIDLLPNIHDLGVLGWENANRDITEIYESIQENIALWCEVRIGAPEFMTPGNDELRNLEMVARQLFPRYKKIRPFLDQEKYRAMGKKISGEDAYGALTLEALFGLPAAGFRVERDLSFVSHLDDLENSSSVGSYNSLKRGRTKALASVDTFATPVVTDSIAIPLSTQEDELSSWIFNGNR